ncbi:MAG: hypothetical protein RJA44_425 [Pseudomonadota bacterium]|jgi:type IV pilus assembly protein PilW
MNTGRRTAAAALPARRRGFTLVEALVALAVGSLLTLAMFGLLTMTETSRRQARNASELQQIGAYVALLLDKTLRHAGSGFAQAAAQSYGCRLGAARSGVTVLPPGGALPAPFDTLRPGSDGLYRLAPVLIAAGQGPAVSAELRSDVLIVMSGHAGLGEAPVPFDGLPGADSLRLRSVQGFRANDLILVTDPQDEGGSQGRCLLQQVASDFVASGAPGSADLRLGGAFHAASIGLDLLADFSLDSLVLNLGQPGGSPSLQLIGVGARQTLYSYDLMRLDDQPLQAIGDSVLELHALYGIASTPGGGVDQWVAPSSEGWRIEQLGDGSATSAQRLQQIKAVKLGLILRSAKPDNPDPAPATLTLFSELDPALQLQRQLDAGALNYRYRSVELTVPLRNHLMLD